MEKLFLGKLGVPPAVFTPALARNALGTGFSSLDDGKPIYQSQVMYRIIGADGKEYGPITADLLRQWIAEGRANAASYVLVEGTPEWKPLGSLPEFSLLFTTRPVGPLVWTAPYPRKTNGFATASFVMGLLSFCVCCCCYGMPFNLLGIVFAIIAIAQIRSNREIYNGQSLAVAGLILSALSILMSIALLLLGLFSSQLDNDLPRHVYRL